MKDTLSNQKHNARLELALSIAIDELKKHLWCGDDFDPEGHRSVHQAFIDINLARNGEHPLQKEENYD